MFIFFEKTQINYLILAKKLINLKYINLNDIKLTHLNDLNCNICSFLIL